MLAAALAGFGLAAGAYGQDDPQGGSPAGQVSALQGGATVARGGQDPAPIARNDPVFHLDVLETAASSLLEVALIDGSRFTLDELSRVTVAEYIVDDEPQGLLSLAFGRLRSIIATTFSSRSDSFKVQTGEGVMGVQGTEFDVIAMADETEVLVWAGEVSVTHVDPQFPEVRIVRAGFTVRFRIDEPVPEPTPIEEIPEADLPPPLGLKDAYLPALVAGSKVVWTEECDIPSRPKPSTAMKPMTLGTQKDVGAEGFVEKQVKNVVGGVLSSVLGGSRSSRSEGARTRRDPTRKQNYLALENPALETELGVRGQWTDDGLLVSTSIEESPDKGTFQSVFLEDCSGRRLYPEKIELYELWTKVKLTVSWTKTTYLNGSVIDRKSGGWSQTWSSSSGRYGRRGGDAGGEPLPIWAQAGYGRAHGGVRQIGAYFKISREELETMGELAFVAHLTRPGQDPVVTAPFGTLIRSGDDKLPAISPMAP